MTFSTSSLNFKSKLFQKKSIYFEGEIRIYSIICIVLYAEFSHAFVEDDGYGCGEIEAAYFCPWHGDA